MEIEFDKMIDICGKVCPMPILYAKNALLKMDSHQILKIISTDPSSELDFRVFSTQTGNRLLFQNNENGIYLHYIQKK